MKLSRILCSKGMKLPRIPQLYLFCTVKPICHFSPTQAISVENRAINMLLTTMIRIACGTDKPIASVTISDQKSTNGTCCHLPKKVLGVCQFARFSDAIAQTPKKLNQPHVLRSGGRGIRSRLLHASVCSCFSSFPCRRTFWWIVLSCCLKVIIQVSKQVRQYSVRLE
jgi:hypothetical protein